MKNKFLVISASMAIMVSGCMSPSTLHVRDGSVTESSAYPEYVQDVRIKTNTNGLLEAQIVLMSPVSRTVNYKIEWIDHDGFALRNPIDERYRALRLTRNEEHVMHKLAGDKRARDLKIYIK